MLYLLSIFYSYVLSLLSTIPSAKVSDIFQNTKFFSFFSLFFCLCGQIIDDFKFL